ncbi:hypothetical protein ACFW9U_23425 [Rhodococcus aetherivorans]|uniref:hypothetical protein n=1 Tax=Rhodococcus aetherivorans TaxID=191292 RepID=UPI0036732DF3
MRQLKLAADRAAAHAADARRFPLPARRDSAEAILADWFGTMAEPVPVAAAGRAAQQLAPANLAAHFGELAKINLHVPTSVASQSESIAIPHLK